MLLGDEEAEFLNFVTSLDGKDECDDETESLAESILTDCESLSVMSEESDHDPGEYDGDNSA